MASELGLEGNVIFTTCSLDALPDFLAAADVVVVPRPFSPGIPTKLLNYMAAAKPIVSFEGSAKFLKYGVNALLVKSEDTFEFGQAIIRLIADKPLAQELGENVKKSIKGTFDWKTIAKKIETIYRSMLGEGKVG
jgi:glycosyltransferase involved in cell wall biosynthesis